MRSLLLLTGERTELAQGELRGALKALGSAQLPEAMDDRAMYFSGLLPTGLSRRMAFCWFHGRLLALTTPDWVAIERALGEAVAHLDPNGATSVKVVTPSRSGPISRAKLFERSSSFLARHGFKVHHQAPDQKLFVVVGERVGVGIIDEESDRTEFATGRGPRLPFNRSIAVEPKLARAMVNLSGLPPGATVLDPFLGPAHLAIEAAKLDLHVVGVERDSEIWHGARENIRAMSLCSGMSAHLADSRAIESTSWWEEMDRVDGIVTDPPFVRSASLMGERSADLLHEVVAKVASKMSAGAPLVVDSDEEKTFDHLPNFNMDQMYPLRIHKSLTRFIGVLTKAN